MHVEEVLEAHAECHRQSTYCVKRDDEAEP